MTVHSVRGLRAFRHRNYQLFFGGQLVSLIGTWMQQVAQAWLVLELTNDVFWLGVVAAAQFVPVMVFGLFGGVLADALPKRQTIFVVQAVMMVLAAILAVLTLTGLVEVWMIIVLALLLGTANAIDMPVRQSFVVEIVGRGDIGNAVALNSAMFNAARVVGPAVAGLTIGAFGSGTAFAINAASFAGVLVALAAMDPTALRTPDLPPRPRSAPQVIEQLREGIAYVRHTPPVLLAILIIGLVSTFGMNFSVVIPALARDVLGTDASGYGFLMTASGVGSLIAAAWLAVSGGLPRVGRMVGGAIALGLAEILLAVSNLFSVSVLLMVIVGFGGITMAATANTMIQLNVPDALRGRAMSVYTTVFAGSTPIGGLLFGWLASVAGVALAVAVGGIGAVVAGLGAFLWVRGQVGFVTVPEPIARRVGARPTATRPADVALAPVEGGVVEAMVGPGARPR
jgi:MFS family permease